MKVRKLRIIRKKYHVSLSELGKASGISEQRVSRLELNPGYAEKETERKLQRGLYSILSRRFDECCSFQKTLERHYTTLTEDVEETTYEL